jgi:GH25 family lysozyme M1 (1,4-beta-N-acetylmuramidase)
VLLGVFAISTFALAIAPAAPAMAAPHVPGIDVSKYQGWIDWRIVSLTGVRFAILRATLGQNYVDPRYAHNLRLATANGIAVGAYHYAKPGFGPRDARVEADRFLRVARVAAGDVVPVLDIEETGGLSPARLRAWAYAWLDRVHARTGVRPMIYAGNSFWRGFMGNTTAFARRGHALWVAHWYVNAPDVPGRRWGGRGYRMWQFSAVGRVPGIRGPVDRDRMRGTLAEGTIASVAVVYPGRDGTIRGARIACGRSSGRCFRLANPGDRIALTATPARHMRLVRWTGACAAAGDRPTCSTTTLGGKRVGAVFARKGARGSDRDEAEPTAPANPKPKGGGPCRAGEPCESPSPSPSPTPAPSPATASSSAAAGPDPAPLTDDGDGTRFSWSERHDRRAIGHSYRWERAASASITYRFRGGAVTLFTIQGRAMGRARISIDGKHVATIDGYASRFSTRVRHRFHDLQDGPHLLTISPLGTKRRSATDRRVVVDALRWGGKLHPDPRPEGASWAVVRPPRASAKRYVESDAAGAQARFPFSGTALTVQAVRGPGRGRAQIWVDGRLVRTVDLYAPRRDRVLIPVVAGLADGPHVARIVVLGSRHPRSRGNAVAIERWIVVYRPERARVDHHGRGRD